MPTVPGASTPFTDPSTGAVAEVWRIFIRELTDAVGARAPLDANYWLSRSNGILTAEQNLGALASGYLKSTQAFGTATPSTVTTIPQADVTGLAASLAGLAPLASPALTGTPTAPTAAPATNTTQLATTAFVIANPGSDATKAPLASPSFTGTVASAGLVDLSGAAAGQIKFPATQNASANANTLDDYEEGTWTPSDGSGAGLTFTSPSGVYTKVGRVVCVEFALTYPVTASGNVASVAGLPFANGGAQFALTTIYTDYGAGIVHYIGAGLSAIGFYTVAAAALTNANLSGKIVRASGVYFV